ncbi:MAG: flagellar export chaperone FlgN [Candidatus Wallbacteria bacterium]
MTAEKIIGILSDIYSKYVTLLQLAKSKNEALLSGKSEQIISITACEERTASEIEALEKERVSLVELYLKSLNLNGNLSLTALLNAGFFKDKAGELEKIKKLVIEIMYQVKIINDENMAMINASKEVIDATLDYIKTKILKQHNQNVNSNNPGTYSKQGVLHKTSKFVQPAASPYGDSQNVMLNFKI